MQLCVPVSWDYERCGDSGYNDKANNDVLKQVTTHEADARDAYVDQTVNLEELRRDEDGNDVGRVELGRLERVLQVMHQPLENVNVAVHADVDVVAAIVARDVRSEIRHLRNQNVLAAHEIFLDVTHLIAHMDDDRSVGSGRLQVIRVLHRSSTCTTALLLCSSGL